LEEIVGKKPRTTFNMPTWARQLRLPGEKRVEGRVEDLAKQLREAKDSQDRYRYHKALLTEQSENLEEVVASAFTLLGMSLQRPPSVGAG